MCTRTDDNMRKDRTRYSPPLPPSSTSVCQSGGQIEKETRGQAMAGCRASSTISPWVCAYFRHSTLLCDVSLSRVSEAYQFNDAGWTSATSFARLDWEDRRQSAFCIRLSCARQPTGAGLSLLGSSVGEINVWCCPRASSTVWGCCWNLKAASLALCGACAICRVICW